MKLNHTIDGREEEILGNLVTYLGSVVSHLQEVKLDKLIYIANLHHYAECGELLTRVPFFSFTRGPHAPTIRSIIKERVKNNAVYLKKVPSETDPSNPCIVIRSTNPSETNNLPPALLKTIRDVIEKWGGKHFRDVIDYTTRSIPFLFTTYRERIDLTGIGPFRGLLKNVLLPAEREQIHRFVQSPEEPIGRSDGHGGDSCPVSINEIAEMYLALCGDFPLEIPSSKNFGFNARAILEILNVQNDGENRGAGDVLTDIDKAAKLTNSLLNSHSFRYHNADVTLKTGLLFLKRQGYSFHRDALNECSLQRYDYGDLRRWFRMVSIDEEV